MLQDLLDQVLALLAQNGNRMSYRAIYETLDYQGQRLLRDALKLGKSQGVIRRENTYDETSGQVAFDVLKVG